MKFKRQSLIVDAGPKSVLVVSPCLRIIRLRRTTIKLQRDFDAFAAVVPAMPLAKAFKFCGYVEHVMASVQDRVMIRFSYSKPSSDIAVSITSFVL